MFDYYQHGVIAMMYDAHYSDKLISKLELFTEKQRTSIYDDTFAIELTIFCSGGCDFCCLAAPSYKGGGMSYDAAVFLAEDMSHLISPDKKSVLEALYYGTDPLDYDDGLGHNYFDVLAKFKSNFPKIQTTTYIPKGKEPLAISNKDLIDRITISHMNRERLKPYFNDLGIAVYLNLPDINFVKIKDPENIIDEIKSLQEVFPILKKYDPHDIKFYDSRKPEDKKPDKMSYNLTPHLFSSDAKFTNNSNFFDILRSDRIIDRDFQGVEDVGRAYSRGYRDPYCLLLKGTKITPEGVFKITFVERSKDNITGQVITEVTPDNFDILFS